MQYVPTATLKGRLNPHCRPHVKVPLEAHQASSEASVADVNVKVTTITMETAACEDAAVAAGIALAVLQEIEINAKSKGSNFN